jgi:hypothetical protein
MSSADASAHCPCGKAEMIDVRRLAAVSRGSSLKRAASSQGSTPSRASADRAVRTIPFSSSPIGAYKKSLNADVRSEKMERDPTVVSLIGSRACAAERTTSDQYGKQNRNADCGEKNRKRPLRTPPLVRRECASLSAAGARINFHPAIPMEMGMEQGSCKVPTGAEPRRHTSE